MLPGEKWVPLLEGQLRRSLHWPCALRNQRMGSGLRTTFTLMWQGKGRMLLPWGFQRRGMHYSVKPFMSTDANSKGDARHSSRSCRGRVDTELCVPAAGRRGLPHPDDSTPVFSLLPFPLLHTKPLMHVHKWSQFYLFATWSVIHFDGHQMEMNKNGFCRNTPFLHYRFAHSTFIF